MSAPRCDDRQREHLRAGFFVWELWKRSGAWTYFPQDEFSQQFADLHLLHRVTEEQAQELRGLIGKLMQWVDAAKFSEIPGARQAIAADETLTSHVIDARVDKPFQRLLKSLEPPRPKRGRRRVRQ